MRDHSHRHSRAGIGLDTVVVVAALAAVFGFAALAVVRGFGSVEVAAVVVAVTTAAERLVSHVKARRARVSPAQTQWGPPAATEDPRPRSLNPREGPTGSSTARTPVRPAGRVTVTSPNAATLPHCCHRLQGPTV